MPKKYYWIIGLAIVVIGVLAVLVYWNNGRKVGFGLKASKASSASCETAQYPFACYLDKAMAAKDPNLCNTAGPAKRIDCLNAYAEILGVALDCNLIKDIDFKTSCQAAGATPK